MPHAVSEFVNGHWEWNDKIKGVAFVSNKEVVVDKLQQQSVIITQAAGCTHADLDLHFHDKVDNLEQIRFRRTIQRQIKPNNPEYVILQDVKDVVLFLVVQKLPEEFIDLFHTHEADRFLRALIFYSQFYLQVCDDLFKRRVISKNKIRQHSTLVVENVIRDNVADLRSMVAREYFTIVMGYGNAKKYHHMANKMNASAPERDIRLIELLLRIGIRVVWVALQRRSLYVIEYEISRMFRTQEFNLAVRLGGRRTRSTMILGSMPIEQRVLYGDNDAEVPKLLARSPAVKEILNLDRDFRLLGTGIFRYDKKDERIEFLESAYTAPERDLAQLKIPMGILGKPRDDFDAMLVSLEMPEENLDEEVELSYKSMVISSLEFMMTESSVYETIRIPTGEGRMEDIPYEMPAKGQFPNRVDPVDQETSRLMWRELQAKKEIPHF